MRLLEFSKRSYKFTEITRSRSSKPVAGQEPSHASAKIGDDLWGQAYQKLTKENKHLVERYEQILFEEEKAVAGNHLTVEVETITSSPGRLTALAKAKLDAFENSKLQISIAGKTFTVQEGLDKIITGVVAAKDFVSGSLASEPHAALAWTGVCICLPFLLNPTKQYEDAREGLLEIPSIILCYQNLEILYSKPNPNKVQLNSEFENKATDLYCKLLEYQVRAVCQWSRSRLSQYFRDVFKADDWVSLFEDIQELDASCRKIGEVMNTQTLHELSVQSRGFQERVEMWYSRQRMREENEEGIQCHQAFGPAVYMEHKNRNPSRVPGTCHWFLDSANFRHWKREEGSSLLWVSADPGCGKSVLARSVIDEKLLFNGSRAPSVCYFFFKDGLIEQQGAARCISALLHQLFLAKPHLIKYALPAYRSSGPSVSSSFSNTFSILFDAAADPNAGEIHCVLDALDECEENDRYLLIDTLRDLYSSQISKNSVSLKFLVTSRPYTDIQRRFTALTTAFPTIRLKGEHESEAISKEINLVIHKIVPEIARELELSTEAENQLRSRLLEVPNRTYLWLHLAIEELRKSIGSTTPKQVDKLVTTLIRNVPKTVEDAYDKILNRDLDKYHEDRRRLLRFVLAAVRPLTLAEGSIALSLFKSQDIHTTEDLDPEKEINFKSTVQTLCGLFVSVVDGRLFLIHQTAREYLLCPASSNLCNSGWKHTFDLTESERLLANCCMTYLRLRDFNLAKTGHFDSSLEHVNLTKSRYPFLAYACLWTYHYPKTDCDEYFDIALDLCNPDSIHFSTWSKISSHVNEIDKPVRMSNWSWLMVVARFGFNTMATRLLKQGESVVTKTDLYGRMALDIAAEYGHTDLVKTLIDTEQEPTEPKQDITRALEYACTEGHTEVVTLLLSRFTSNTDQREWGTPLLHIATFEHHTKVVQVILQLSKVNVNAKGGYWGTALQTAAFSNDIEIAQILFANGANANLNCPNIEGDMCGVPISLAASRGHLEMIRLLAENGADIDGTVGSGGDSRNDTTRRFGCDSALVHAASETQVEALQLLLQLGADLGLNVRQDHEQDPASDNVFEKVCMCPWNMDRAKMMSFLLGLETNTNRNVPKFALSAAAHYGDTKILQLVLKKCSNLERVHLVEALRVVCLRIAEETRPPALALIRDMNTHLEARLQ